MKEYKVILMDLDHTIFDFDHCEEVSLKKAFMKQGAFLSDALLYDYRQWNLSIWHDIEKGIYSIDDLTSVRFPAFFEKHGLRMDHIRLEEDFHQELCENVYLMPYAFEALQILSADAKIYAASNGYLAMQKKRLVRSGIDSFFSGVFVSDDVGFSKPDPRFFDFILNRIKIDRAEVLMVGDSVSSDMAGGRLSGIDTCLINPSEVEAEVTYHYPNLRKMTEEWL